MDVVAAERLRGDLAGFTGDVFASLSRAGWRERAAWYQQGLMIGDVQGRAADGLSVDGVAIAVGVREIDQCLAEHEGIPSLFHRSFLHGAVGEAACRSVRWLRGYGVRSQMA